VQALGYEEQTTQRTGGYWDEWNEKLFHYGEQAT